MGEIFLRQLKLEPPRGEPWLTVCVDLDAGPDLSDIDFSTLRLNDSVALAETRVQGDTLRLSFPRGDVCAYVGSPDTLTITGRFADGVSIRGSVQCDS